MHSVQRPDGVDSTITFERDGVESTVHGEGNGSIDAVSNALKEYSGVDYKLLVYSEHSMQGHGSGSIAAAYIGLETSDGELIWGAGEDTDIIKASINALIAAFNNLIRED